MAALTCAAAFWPACAYLALGAAAALLALVAADVGLGPRAQDVTVSRKPLGHLALGCPAVIGYTIANRSGTALRYSIVDTPVDFVQLRGETHCGRVGANRRKDEELSVTPIERGLADFGPIYVTLENRIGLLRRRRVYPAADCARVFPDLSLVERYGMLARSGRLLEAGFRKLRLRGGGGEFDSLREWTPDDAFGSVDWKATARRAKLMVATYDVERSQTVLLVLDAGRLMMPRIGPQRKFDYALTAALSVAALAGQADDKVGLTAFAAKIVEHVPPRSGARHASALVRRMYGLQPRFEEADYAGAFNFLRRSQAKRSLVVFFSDMFDPVAAATILAHAGLLARRHLVMCVLLNDEAIDDALSQEPRSALEAYRAGVAAGLQAERAKAVAMLNQRGILVVDVPASRLTMALINAYVDVKSRGLL
ncbi:MAG: DUF58 domain-containing protein [Candidatus Eremiobacteraeota bacterium]|nr:DUF58 domain-containing protein [Candidatus Eremiobacteraeota bacterium]